MPAGSPRHRRAPVLRFRSRTGHRRSPGLPSVGAPRRLPRPASHRARHPGFLARTCSAPAVLAMPSTSDGNGGRDEEEEEEEPPESLQILPRHYTCVDICSPTLALSVSPPRSMEGGSSGDKKWEGKVLVTVTVEGSPGPVRAMVKLGATVEEAIGAVVDAYGREGRSPRLDPAAISSFQLHHNHFCLQSLDKKETLGQVGGRNFYLRRNRGIGGGGAGVGDAAAAARSRPGEPLVALSTHRFLCVSATRLGKLGRRLGKLWRAFGCVTCG